METIFCTEVHTIKKGLNMKRLILLSILLLAPAANADLLNGGYMSPENYAVNEADLQDYRYASPPPKLNIDNLDDMRFNAPNIVEKDIQIGKEDSVAKDEKSSSKKKAKKETTDDEAYKKKLSYKFAKWWFDQRYKRAEPHHGSLHEIKVDKRIKNEEKQ